MNLNYSVREISYNKFLVIDSEGVEVSNELPLETAADLIRRFENADRMDKGLALYTKDDMPAILAALAGTDTQDAVDACAAHTWQACGKLGSDGGCTPGGRKCSESLRLWEVAHRLHNWTRAPFATINRWGTRHGHLTMAVAMADAEINGGQIIKAPEGAYEAEMAKRAEEKKAADKRLEERRAYRALHGRSMPRRRF